MRPILPITLRKGEVTYVEYGFAPFVDPETNLKTDEPLVTLAVTH